MIGIDIVKIERISRLHAKFGVKFAQKFLSEKERHLATSDATMAGFWAAKEAVSKALGSGIGRECGFLDIKIHKSSTGAPRAKLAKSLRKKIKRKIHLSITHDGGFAVAVAVLS